MTKIYNVMENSFGGWPRKGDIIGIMNVVEHLRMVENDPTLQFYLPKENTNAEPEFIEWLLNNTTQLTNQPGEVNYPHTDVSVWAYRIPPSESSVSGVFNAGEFLKIPNNTKLKKKICIFPIFDVQYHTFRLWSVSMTESLIRGFMTDEYKDHEKYLCIKAPTNDLNLYDFELSTDLLTNINHILNCDHYVGGETGLTLFASVLDNPNRTLQYFYAGNSHYNFPYYSARPFYLKDGQLTEY